MTFSAPEQFNMAHYFLDARIEEGMGNRVAIRCGDSSWTYEEIQQQANRFANILSRLGVRPEERVAIGLPDGADWVGAFFGILKLGAVVVMLNPYLKPEEIEYFYEYTRCRWVLVHPDLAEGFVDRASGSRHLHGLLAVGGDLEGCPRFEKEVRDGDERFENFSTHADDPAVWLFSGGTTGKPKAVVQAHTSFANTTECYAKGVIGYGSDDTTLSIPKLYFGYATGSNLLFPFSVGATVALFPERSTSEEVFRQIEAHQPTILINVPTMIGRMVDAARDQSVSFDSLRLATSAGEALPLEIHEAWSETFGIELLDGLGTAEMWHIFLSNRPGDVYPGTLGKVVPGFEVVVRDENENCVSAGEVGVMWVRGNSRAIQYWQKSDRTQHAFRGEWYVTGDLVLEDENGCYSHHGRADEMLKVSGKWLAPQEVEGCLLQHPAVHECAVVGWKGEGGLITPKAYLVAEGAGSDLETELKAFVKDRLETYKHPREIEFVEALPRTHLGKVARGALRNI